MPRPTTPPTGVVLAATAKAVSEAFDEALGAAGGTRPTWLVLMALRADTFASQQQIATRVGIRGATLTYHLNSMEADGLVVRRRDPENRRVHLVELTADGDALFHRLRTAAVGFDRRLTKGLSGEELGLLRDLLQRLAANVEG